MVELEGVPMRQIELAIFGILTALAIAIPAPVETAPPEGLTLLGRVVEVHDGDTVTVEVTTRMRVRLIDCWAPEVMTDRRVPAAEQAAAKAAGNASREYLQQMVSKSPNCRLHIPRTGDDIGDVTSMGRVLGKVWLADDATRSVSERMVSAGHATKTKQPWGPR